MKSLFYLSEEIQALEAELEREDITDEQRVAFVDAWLATQGDLIVKLDNYAAYIKQLEALSAAREEEARRLAVMAAANQNRANSLRARLKTFLETHGYTRFETVRFKLAVQMNGGKVPIIVPPEWETDPASAPEAFQRREIRLDKNAIRTAIENSDETYGARLGERETSVRIR
ncbi:MAG: siphovirus Gp157 family protein [Acidobacteria bacterium]|nr:siphovirus Gp157 family protein [Acidobacteriota bacterium]